MLHKLSVATGAEPVELLCSGALISRDDPQSTDPGRKGISTAHDPPWWSPNPLAGMEALAALKNGGNTIEVMVTAQEVLAVVEPQSSAWQVAVFCCNGEAAAASFKELDGPEVGTGLVPLPRAA